jgi:hypothetical protein
LRKIPICQRDCNSYSLLLGYKNWATLCIFKTCTLKPLPCLGLLIRPQEKLANCSFDEKDLLSKICVLMLKRKSFFDKIDQMCCEESVQISYFSYWGWETVNYLGFAAKSWLVEAGCGVWKEPQRHRGHKD